MSPETIAQELPIDKSNWCIKSTPDIDVVRRIIINTNYPTKLTEAVYNYTIYTPIVLAPISRSSTFILSAYIDHKDELCLMIHDLRLVDGEIVNSVGFTLRGNPYQLGKFKNDMSRVADEDRCVGVSYFFRKLFYNNFRTIYCDKVLKPKQNSTLRAAISVVKSTMLGVQLQDEHTEESDHE